MMKPSDHRELWDDALADSMSADFADDALTTLLTGARKRRRRRAAVKGATVLALILPVVFLALRPAPESKGAPAPTLVVQQLPDPPAPAAPSEPEPQIQVLSDDELLAQFPGRAVAIIGTGDSKQLVFLDKED